MNAVGLLLVWVALQVSVFCLVGIGLYAVARRRSPAAGAWAAGTLLVMAVGLSALALSPWPEWWSLDETAMLGGTADGAGQETEADGAPAVRLAPGMLAGPLEPRGNGHWPDADAESRHKARADTPKLLARLRNSMTRSTAGLSTSSWHWPAWLAVAVAAGCVVALARLLVAIVAAHRYRALARPLADSALAAELARVCREMGCAPAIELREAAGLGSPATMGWRRPAIILPADWRTWSADERRAVLAHEVAHVVRGDFAASLVGQVCVVLHFYNPLVHWLARRLRLEQEMAADVWGAQLLGSRQRYLTTLAHMALRASDPPIAWAARPFLPTRGTLMRRVEMLHQQKILPNVSLSRGRRTALAVAVILVGCFVAGLRGPGARALVDAAPPSKAEQTAAAEPFNLDFVPDDAQVVLALRPAELADVKTLAPLKEMLTEAGVFKPLDLPLADIEEFKFIAGGDVATGPGWGLFVLRSKQPHDWTKLGANVIGPVEKAIGAGQEYYRAVKPAPNRGSLGAYWLPDDRTIVIAPPEKIIDTFSLRGPVNQPAWAAEWQKIASAPAALAITPALLQPFVAGGDAGVNMTEQAERAFFSAKQMGDAFHVTGTLPCRSAEAALEIAASLQTNLQEVAKHIKNDPGIPALMAQVIDATKIEALGAAVRSQTAIDARFGRSVAAAIGPARAAAKRAQSVSTMKQIAIAMHNYHDKNGHFPSAVVTGPDGKTPHSWRVELLPYFEMEKLRNTYNEYKLDEPWDSDHNRKLIEAGAEFFGTPLEKPNGDSCYFMLAGPGTVADPANPGPQIRNITDGSSRTIFFVEAKRSIPWTKPEDIEYDPDKPLPELGGFFEGGFDAALVDGSVRFLPTDLDEATLRALLSANGREIINFDPQTGVPKVQE